MSSRLIVSNHGRKVIELARKAKPRRPQRKNKEAAKQRRPRKLEELRIGLDGVKDALAASVPKNELESFRSSVEGQVGELRANLGHLVRKEETDKIRSDVEDLEARIREITEKAQLLESKVTQAVQRPQLDAAKAEDESRIQQLREQVSESMARSEALILRLSELESRLSEVERRLREQKSGAEEGSRSTETAAESVSTPQ
jgi:chromosome segregation ATPase